MSVADELTKLKELQEQGILSEDEFNAQKAKLLGTDVAPAPDVKPDASGPEGNESASDSADATATPPAPDITAKSPAGKKDAGLSGKAIGGIVGGVLILLTLIIVLVFVLKDASKDTSEPIDNLDKIYKGAAVYYSTPFIDPTGQKLPCQFPTNQGVTPVEGTCCSTSGLGGPDSNQDDRCDANPAMWDETTWSALTFQINDEHYFVYAFDSEGELSDSTFQATANGDADCDSIQSTFQRIAFGDETANLADCSLKGAPAMFIDQERE